MSTRLYVGNLEHGTTEEDLAEVFSRFSTYDGAKMGRYAGYAFVVS